MPRRELLVHPECDYTWYDPGDETAHFCMLTPGHNGHVHVCSCDAAIVMPGMYDDPASGPIGPAAKGPYTPRRRCLMTCLLWRLVFRWAVG